MVDVRGAQRAERERGSVEIGDLRHDRQRAGGFSPQRVADDRRVARTVDEGDLAGGLQPVESEHASSRRRTRPARPCGRRPARATARRARSRPPAPGRLRNGGGGTFVISVRHEHRGDTARLQFGERLRRRVRADRRRDFRRRVRAKKLLKSSPRSGCHCDHDQTPETTVCRIRDTPPDAGHILRRHAWYGTVLVVSFPLGTSVVTEERFDDQTPPCLSLAVRRSRGDRRPGRTGARRRRRQHAQHHPGRRRGRRHAADHQPQRKVHEKYAEYDRRQAQTQAAANDAEAAYESERRRTRTKRRSSPSYKHEVAIQHEEVLRLRHQLAMTQSAHRRRTQQPALRPLVAGTR